MYRVNIRYTREILQQIKDTETKKKKGKKKCLLWIVVCQRTQHIVNKSLCLVSRPKTLFSLDYFFLSNARIRMYVSSTFFIFYKTRNFRTISFSYDFFHVSRRKWKREKKRRIIRSVLKRIFFKYTARKMIFELKTFLLNLLIFWIS